MSCQLAYGCVVLLACLLACCRVVKPASPPPLSSAPRPACSYVRTYETASYMRLSYNTYDTRMRMWVRACVRACSLCEPACARFMHDAGQLLMSRVDIVCRALSR